MKNADRKSWRCCFTILLNLLRYIVIYVVNTLMLILRYVGQNASYMLVDLPLLSVWIFTEVSLTDRLLSYVFKSSILPPVLQMAW